MSDSVRLIVLLSGLAALASAEIQSLSQVKKVPFDVCVDDSDCRGLGPDYDCFQYICYPWRDDSKIDKANRMELCRSNNECSGGKECFRHHNRRSVTKGLCMEPAVDCQENGEADCKAPKGSKGRNQACCNGEYCCDQEYFDLVKKLPCTTNEYCRMNNYGQFCCPNKANSTLPSQCCNVDPNPPPPTTRRPRPSAVSGTWLLESSLTFTILILLAPALRQ